MHEAFRKAVEARDLDAARAALSPGIVLQNPGTSGPITGIDAVVETLAMIDQVLPDLRYLDEYHAQDGSAAVHFEGHVGDQRVEGVDLLWFDDQGLIREFTVLLRPVEALMAIGRAVAAKRSA